MFGEDPAKEAPGEKRKSRRVRTPLKKSKKILGVPVENLLTSYFL